MSRTNTPTISSSSLSAPPKSDPSSSPTSVMMTMDMDNNNNNNNNNDKVLLLSSPRSCILQIGVSAGKLCSIANTHLIDYDSSNNKSKNNTNRVVLILAIKDVLMDLWKTSMSLKLNLSRAIQSKMDLNNKKYPVELCKGKSGKYTQYSNQTGITSTNQSTMKMTENDTNNVEESSSTTSLEEFVIEIPKLSSKIEEFATAREWSKYHTPRNLVLAFMGELGELSELLQWDGDDNNDSDNRGILQDYDAKRMDKLSQELADVTIYMLRLATVCNVVDELCNEMME